MTILKILEKLGYTEIQTGGGCTALYKETDDKVIMITRKDDPISPDHISDPVTIGIYDKNKDKSTLYIDFDRLGEVSLLLLAKGRFE